MSDAAKPGPKRLADVRDLAVSSGTPYLAIGAITSPDLIKTVAVGTDLKAILIDPLGMDIPPGPDFYPALIQSIADGFSACLKGTGRPTRNP